MAVIGLDCGLLLDAQPGKVNDPAHQIFALRLALGGIPAQYIPSMFCTVSLGKKITPRDVWNNFHDAVREKAS